MPLAQRPRRREPFPSEAAYVSLSSVSRRLCARITPHGSRWRLSRGYSTGRKPLSWSSPIRSFCLWHRKGFRLLWRWKSRPKGRPTLPEELKKLIAEMAVANITWGEERIAHELLVKLGVRVSPRTVRKYIPIRDDGSPDRRNASHRWATFVGNHAKAVVAADFFNVVTVSFRVVPSIYSSASPWVGSQPCGAKYPGFLYHCPQPRSNT